MASTLFSVKYDENLEENEFLKRFKTDYAELFEKSIEEGWLISVPRRDVVPSDLVLRPEDVTAHLFVQDDLDNEHEYRSLIDKRVRIRNNTVSVFNSSSSTEPEVSRTILFSETFYDDRLHKYRVLCLDDFLGQSRKSRDLSSENIRLNSLNDCIEHLCVHDISLRVNLDHAAKRFQKNQTSVTDVIKSCMGRSSVSNTLKLAAETYFLNRIYNKIMIQLNSEFSQENSSINRWINVGKIGPLNSIREASTPLDKISILLRYLDSENGNVFETDDLLSTLISTISNTWLVKNWYSQFKFMKNYRFTSNENVENERTEYILTSLEAALEHILKVSAMNHLPSPYQCVSELISKIQAGCDVKVLFDAIDVTEMTPLHVASIANSPNLVESLIKDHGLDIFTKDSHGRTALHLASEFGHQSVVLVLLQAQEKEVFSTNEILNVKDQDGRVPLHWACLRRQESTIKAILYYSEHRSRPLRIDADDNAGNTPMHIAAMQGHSGIVQMLLDYSADTKVLNKRGQTPYECALNKDIYHMIKNSSHDVKYDYFLINEKTQKEYLETNRETSPLKSNEETDFFRSIMTGDVDAVRNYLRYHDPHSINSEGKTGLHLAAQLDFIEVMELLLDYGADPFSIIEETGETPLHLAARNGHGRAVSTLCFASRRSYISHKKGVNAKDKMGNVALHYCALTQNYEMVLTLLSAGASPSEKNVSGISPLEQVDCRSVMASLLSKKL